MSEVTSDIKIAGLQGGSKTRCDLWFGDHGTDIAEQEASELEMRRLSPCD